MPTTDQRAYPASDGATTADLVRLASEQTARLVREELALARAEMTEKARRAGTGAGLVGAAGVIALYGVAALLATVVALLALALPVWAAALIVTVALFAAAGIVALVGRARLRTVGRPIPEQTVHSVGRDVRRVAQAARRTEVHR